MNTETIKKLNEVNAKFYQSIATSFSGTRQHAWSGWERAWQHVANLVKTQGISSLDVCDVGCGNGRFGLFCAEKFIGQQSGITLNYQGIDQDHQLLSEAKKNLDSLPNKAVTQLIHQDLIQTLLEKKLITSESYDLVVSFGVLHHVPSRELRREFVQQLASNLKKGGLLILTCWRFDRNPQLLSRQVQPGQMGFSSEELEENDFFLTWEKDTPAVRYCHLVTTLEQDELIAATELRLLERYSADGKTDDQNEYLVLQRID